MTHAGLFRQNGRILSEVFLYMERSKNLENKYVITIKRKFTFPKGFDSKNTVDMRKGTVKHIKVFQILSSFRNIILSVPTTFVQDCSVLSISFNICQIIYKR